MPSRSDVPETDEAETDYVIGWSDMGMAASVTGEVRDAEGNPIPANDETKETK